MSTEMKVKSFFDRPEGKTGMIFIVIGLFAFLVAGNTIMPYVIMALQNTLHAAALAGVLLAIIALAMNKNFRFLCATAFKSAMRAITGLFISIDPIGILKNYISDMVDRIREIEDNILKLKGQHGKIKDTIKTQRESAEESMRMAASAKKQGKNDQATVYARKAARANGLADKLEPADKKIELLYRILDKTKRNLNMLLEDTKDEVASREIEYESIKAAHKAMSSADKLINGDSNRDMFEQSMQFIADDIGTKLGEMDRYMDLSADFMDNIDIQNGMWDEKGMEMLEQWEKTGSLLSYEADRGAPAGLTNNYTPPKQLPTASVGTSTVGTQQFEAFFSKKN